MSISKLPAEWQQWITENVARGCSRESMRPLLVQGGHAPALVDSALDAAWGLVPPPTPALPTGAIRPAPALGGNHILLSDGQPVRVAAVLDAPQVVLFENVLSPADCDAMITLAQTRLERSTVVDVQRGAAQAHTHRTSAGAMFQRGEHALLARIEARLAELLCWPLERGEGLQVLSYAAGGEYRAHFDYFDPALPGSTPHLLRGGQRVGTCILYLDDVAAGGATRFPSIGYEVRPMRGAALYFANVDARGQTDAKTLHAGLPVVAGVKYIATKWLRQQAHGG